MGEAPLSFDGPELVLGDLLGCASGGVHRKRSTEHSGKGCPLHQERVFNAVVSLKQALQISCPRSSEGIGRYQGDNGFL